MEGFRKRGGMYSSPHQITPNSTNRARRETLDVYRHDREKGANIQVILRCRPLNDEEVKAKAACIITCNENRGEVSAMHNIANKQIGKTFEFDKVFGPTSQQNDIFDHAISPMVNEVLEGYNCTVFAYGQTGTGKTYTMEGGKTKSGDFPEDAGVIPRSVRQIFDILESQNAEYSMKVTFLELYNEEITDLLAPESKFSDDKLKKPLALMEDGKGGVLVRGLEEEIVTSASEIYKILDEGSAKKHTAESLLNKQSSRSHSIFSITIHIKECTLEGEELIKCGKLNLVDLAGSENITRSGARDGRAREAGEINKSLLTLGRVINALVDHSAHIPYRDSKLTRLLRDSLGGKTKTCIIATISPSIHCLEESLSTLDYAYRAKNIKNKPEVNQKLMKSELIKDLYSEIDRLKQELHAAREKNGVYIPTECYIQDEAKKKAMTEKVEQFKLELIFKEKKFVEIQNLYNSQKHINEEQSRELEKTLSKFEDTGHAFFQLEERYRQAKQTIREKDHFISNLLKSEKALVQHAHVLRSELEDVALDVPGLFAKIDRKDTIEEENRAVVQKFHARLSQQLDLLHTAVSSSVPQQENQLKEVEEEMLAFVATKSKATEKICGQVGKLKDSCNSGIRALNYFANELDVNTKSTFDKINSQIVMHRSTMQKSFESIAIEASKLQKELDNNLSKLEEIISSFAQKQREGLLRTADTTRSISNVINNFFDGLEMQSSKLNVILEERQQVQDQQFCALEKKFEEISAYEEKILLEKLSELVACSRVRKQELLQVAVSDIRACTADNTSTLGNEISAACKINSSVRNEWAAFIEKAENNYLKDTALIDTQQNYFVEGLKQCMDNTKCNAQQWEKAQESIKNINGETVASVSSFISAGSETNQLLLSKHTSAETTTTNDVNEAGENLISSIKCSLKLDHDIKDSIHCATLPYHEELKGLLSGHDHRVSEIKNDSRNHLEVEYKMDEPTCSTPKRRMVNVPSMISIEETRTPAFEESLKSFSEPKFCYALRQPLNGEGRESSGAYDSSNIRLPFATINKLI